MKKNVKYLGMAAAALLAVAPVAATGVANAATISVQGGTAKPTTNKGGNIAATLTATNVASLKPGANPDTVTADLSATLNGQAITPKVFGDNKAYVVPASLTDYSQDSVKDAAQKIIDAGGLQANTQYKLVIPQVGFTGLTPSSNDVKYTYNDIATSGNFVSIYGNSAPVAVVGNTFEISQGNAYFTQNINGSNTVVNDSTSVDLNGMTTVSDLATYIQNTVVASNTNDTLKQSNKTALESQIKNALANAGVTVNANGSFVAPVTDFTVPYTAQFPNGSSATINVTVKVGKNTSTSTVNQNGPEFIFVKDNGVGVTENDGKYTKTIKQGDNFDANALLKAFNVNYSYSNDTKLTNATVASNDVNTSVPGNYSVVISATNPAGVTNKVTVNVTVASNGITERKVSYVPGYYVYAWNINGNRATITSTRYIDGSTVNTTGDAVTVAGIKYYKLVDNGLYIPAQYVDGSYKPENKPSNDNNDSNKSDEEALSGVLTVKYDGKGKVALMDGEGHYTGQFLDKNTKWKVFAKKTIKGQTCYRLGTDKQWIPAKYSELDK